jgi:Spy/CpxP family protein refolding chaperone
MIGKEMPMRKTFSGIAVVALFAACASTDSDMPPQGRQGQRRPPAQRMEGQSSTMALDIVPLTDWWHEPMIASAVNLSSDQYTKLDQISAQQRDDIVRIDRDSGTAMRDLRTAIDTDPAAINNAAERVRALRDALFNKEVQLVASERGVLTSEQWQTLHAELQRSREEQRGGGNRSGGGQGGRRGGGGGGHGRWPGF